MAVKLTNNAFATLAGSITSSQTTITLTSGQGARFPVLQPGDWFWGTLNNAANNIEIVKVTATATDTFTVVRGQDNTIGLAWNAGDKFELRTPAALFGNYMDQATFNTWFVGVITMWSGSIASIPPHWHICDGTNGTPDLRDRFVIGAGNSYPVANTGGNVTNTLSVSQLPSHGHGVTDPGHAHGVYDPGHNHGVNDPGHGHGVNDPGHSHSTNIDFWTSGGSTQGYLGPGGGGGHGQYGWGTSGSGTGVSIQGNGTGIWLNGSGTGIGIYGSGTGVSIQSTGSGAAIENRPPWYALAYIMYTG